MRWKYVFKLWARSRSLNFALRFARNIPAKQLAKVRWRGRDVFYRPGTSDATILYAVLLKRGTKAEYYLPSAVAPEVILDIGSHIGTSILYFHDLFPRAQIFGFEPHPETFAVLQQNVADLPNVSVFNYGLGTKDDSAEISFAGSDYSAFSVQPDASQQKTAKEEARIEIRATAPLLQNLGIAKADLIKIDCEGAELDVLAGLPEALRNNCKWITGEMHDASAFQILNLLAPRFDLDLRKTMFQAKFRFHACNTALVPSLRGQFDPAALQI